jgi:hypothetical protein
MKAKLIGAALALLMTSGAAIAFDDQDITPVTQCEGLPPSVTIMLMSWSDTAKVCREMARVLVGVRRKDITNFEKAIVMLNGTRRRLPDRLMYGGYEGDNTQVAKELVEIIRLRGLYDQPDRWDDTNDIIIRSWAAYDGVVGPRDVIAFLRGAGTDMAKSLSDDGLIAMIVLIKRDHQSGN